LTPSFSAVTRLVSKLPSGCFTAIVPTAAPFFSTAQMLDWFKGAAREPGGFYGYYKTLAEELRAPATSRPAPLSASGLRRW